MRIFLILAFVWISAVTSTFAQTPTLEPGVSQTLAKWRAAHYSDVRYKLNITLEKGAPTLKGTIEIRVKLSEPPALAGGSTVILDWRKIKGKEDLFTISNVSINDKVVSLNPPANAGGSDLRYEEINEHLVFKDGVKIGENVIKLDFTSPIATSGAAVTRYVDKEDGAEYVYSLFVPSDASTAFPVFDQPDLKARFQLNVIAPKEWNIISNTVSEENLTLKEKGVGFNGAKNYIAEQVISFEETKPISTYVFAFAAGDFRIFIDEQSMKSFNKNATTEFRLFVRKSQLKKADTIAKEVFRLNREGVKFLEDWFDYKFPFPKYDLVLIPEFPFGGMEHAGATFLREDRIIFPTEPTKNDYITRANVIFHEAAHQWFGDTVTMKWFDDLWLKEGFAEFMAYKTLAKVMPEYNAWKVFYERNKQAAYLTDSTRGTTPIYQEIPNLSSAKSAYGNIVYRKAPSFLRQAEFYLGEKEFQTAVRAFLKKHEFANAEWTDLVKEFETASKQDLQDWANVWVKQKGIFKFRTSIGLNNLTTIYSDYKFIAVINDENNLGLNGRLVTKFKVLSVSQNGTREIDIYKQQPPNFDILSFKEKPEFVFPNYQDYGYGIFLLDDKSRAYVLENIQNEKDDFLRSMMWGSLWDSVRFYELAPEDYVKLVIKNINVETDESTIAALLNRVSTAMNYYLSEPPASAGGLGSNNQKAKQNPSANADGTDKAELAAQLEKLLIEKMQNAPTLGQRITYYRAFVSLANSENARNVLKELLRSAGISAGNERDSAKSVQPQAAAAGKLPALRVKDKFDIVTRLITLGDADGLKLLAELEKTETDDAAKRYAYAARAGIPSAENKAKYWNDFTGNKELSESWIETAFVVWNSPRHSALTLPYLEKALAELPNLKRNRKIFFVNGWLAAFIGGQKSEEALNIVNGFLEKNPNLDKDLRLKILENSDNLERAVRIKGKISK